MEKRSEKYILSLIQIKGDLRILIGSYKHGPGRALIYNGIQMQPVLADYSQLLDGFFFLLAY